MTYIKKLTPQEIKTIALQEPKFIRKDILSKDDLLATVKAYFRFCIEKEEPPTMSGLAMSLGVTRKDLLSLTHHDPEINRIIEIGKQTIVEHIEKLLISGKPPIGLIFWLKNNDDWIDKTTTEHQERSISQIMDDLERQHKVVDADNPLLNITGQAPISDNSNEQPA